MQRETGWVTRERPHLKPSPASIIRDEFPITRIGRVALTFRVTELVLRNVHDETGDRSYRRIRRGACAWLILPLLVVGFPQQAQLKARQPPLLRISRQAVHLVLFHTAAKGESAVSGQQNSRHTQRRHLCKLPAFS